MKKEIIKKLIGWVIIIGLFLSGGIYLSVENGVSEVLKALFITVIIAGLFALSVYLITSGK